jgi:hypothetical protein
MDERKVKKKVVGNSSRQEGGICRQRDREASESK